MTGLDGMKVEDLTQAEFEGRRRIHALVDYVRANSPGFEHCYVVDVAPQVGVRQTRLLEGEYVVTKEDVQQRVHFPDSVARGRDYYTPYRALLPKGIDQLLVAGPALFRHVVGAKDFAGNSALHGDGRSGRALPRRWP